MTSDDDFLPRLGRQRSRGSGARARSALGAILAAATLARGGAQALSRTAPATCRRIGRGSGVGQVLASRDASPPFAPAA